MKKFRIRVNDKVFDVEVEEVAGEVPAVAAPASNPQPVAAPRAPAPTPTPVAVPKPVSPAPAPAAAPAGTGAVKSPLPGKVLKVVATPGGTYKKGDTLVVIEAMKMENEILAPRDCTVEEVLVEANQTVKTGDVLLKLA
ncbi:MAG TPA: biotin/lipoyl-binding protein [Candidatus Cryosericum sp.]|nr:biotin/lipoyl-binding protein [Candidatus Cryosericum sp.]HPS69287.1 biotin/lipoyl-binding protein [Candidatus Cryosericum sp.]